MPIEVTSSPSITDTLRSYTEYSYQPSLFAKISTTSPADNWIIQEQPIAMEDAAVDVSYHRSLSWSLSSLSCFSILVVLGKNSCLPHHWFRFSAVITKSTPCTAIKPCLKACPPSNIHPFSLAPPRLTKTRHPTIPCRRIRLFQQVCGILSFERTTHDVSGNASWDLTDGIARLNINGAFDSGENIHGPIRTPPKTKLVAEPVVQLHDTSPLESPDTSLDSRPSPPASDEHLALANHSRVSSADTTASTQLSGSSHTLASSALGLKVGPEQRDRPHSYSGGLSTADLQRLRGVGPSPPDGERAPQWGSTVDRQSQYDQPLYPSLSSHPRQSVDLQVDYTTQQRQFQPLDGTIPSPQAFNGRSSGAVNGAAAYRSQPGRGYNPGLVSNGTYPGPGHTAHLSLGNTQQIYDMMMPSHENPSVARVQQQHNVFRATHQHSSSDPIHLREATALLSGGLPSFQPGLYPPTLGPPTMSIYPNQFYAPHEAYANAGVAAQVMAAARLQSQFQSQYHVLPGQSMSPVLPDGNLVSGSSVDISGNGPSANNRKLGLYKTELCRSWEEKGTCRYGPKCQFAHGEEEIRKVARHPKVGP